MIVHRSPRLDRLSVDRQPLLIFLCCIAERIIELSDPGSNFVSQIVTAGTIVVYDSSQISALGSFVGQPSTPYDYFCCIAERIIELSDLGTNFESQIVTAGAIVV